MAIWLDLSDDDQKDHEKAKKSVVDGIMPMAFTSLEEFHHRKLHPGESLSVYVHNLKVLIECAMPDIDATSRGQLLLHQFLAGIPLQVSRQLRAMDNITDLQQVVEKARLLMAIEEQPDNAGTLVNAVQESTLVKLQSQVEALTQQVATLTTHQPATMSLSPTSFLPSPLLQLWPDGPSSKTVLPVKHQRGTCTGQQVAPQSVGPVTEHTYYNSSHSEFQFYNYRKNWRGSN